MSAPIAAQEVWCANTPHRIYETVGHNTVSVDRPPALTAHPEAERAVKDIPNEEPPHRLVCDIPNYSNGTIPPVSPGSKIDVPQASGLLKPCWNPLVDGRNISSERDPSLMERQDVFITEASMGESSLIHNPNSGRHLDNDVDPVGEYDGNEGNIMEISRRNNPVTDEVEEINLDHLTPDGSLSRTQRALTSADIPLKLDFFFYNIEEPEYHLAPKCNDKLLDCFRFIAQQNGTIVFCYCLSQGNGRFKLLAQGHFGCGKIWMDIKRHLEEERWSIRYVDFNGHECWIGLLYSRRRESRSFAKYSPRDRFLREHYVLSHECCFVHTPTWRRIRECMEPEYERNDTQFFSDKATQTVNGVTTEIGTLKFKMFDAEVEDPAGILENSRFLLGKSVRTMKNKRSISDCSRKKMLLAEERFLKVEQRMTDPNIIT